MRSGKGCVFFPMNIKKFAGKHRIRISQIYFLILLFFFLFTGYSWTPNSFLDIAVEGIGFILIVICGLGRIWASMYIYGYKDNKLITEGPYSMVRNPLYFFSFLGGIGIGLASKNLISLLLILIFFILYYPFVIRAEEDKLKELHGEQFEEYRKKTPGFFPRFSQYKDIDEYVVKPGKYRETFLDVMWFFWFYLLLKIIEVLHINGILPVFFTVP